ncbi:MAG: class I SAM-dependent methyltransferase, partial [Acetobacteraceae bacterium]
HYRAGRPGYSPALIRRVARLCRLGSADRTLDLGCGPGPLAAAFAPFVAEVVAVDPEPEMLACVTELAVGNITAWLGSSYDMGAELGRFRLAVMGRSFHWMDRPDTLRRLDGVIEPGGAVALFFTHHPDVSDNAWTGEFRTVRLRYTGDDPARAAIRAPGWASHEAVLLDSPFAHVESAAALERRRVPVSALIDRALSMSGTSPQRLGDRVDDLTREITAARAPHAVDGVVAEIIESRAVLGFRPGEQPE